MYPTGGEEMIVIQISIKIHIHVRVHRRTANFVKITEKN
jgi:hypothetical protein